MIAAALAPDGTVLEANPALERLAGPALAGTAFDALIQARAARRVRAPARRGRARVESARRSRSPRAAPRSRPTGASGCARAGRRGPAGRRAGDRRAGAPRREGARAQRRARRRPSRARPPARGAPTAAERIRNLEAISAAGLVNLRLDDLLSEVLRIIAEAVGSERAVLLLLDDDGEVLVARAAVGLDGVELDEIRVPIGVGRGGQHRAPRTGRGSSPTSPRSRSTAPTCARARARWRACR